MESLLRRESADSKAVVFLAAGCFWGAEAYYKKVAGILKTEVCYVNGKTAETRYSSLKESDHAEAVELTYDPAVIHLAEILDRFYRIIDPFSVNRQGPDVGRQYRSGIYTVDEVSLSVATLSLELLRERLGAETAIELLPLKNKVRAEAFHQDYLDKNPGGYCHINLAEAEQPLYPALVSPDEEQIKEMLSDLSYEVLRKQSTEAPFSSELDQWDRAGIYVDPISGQALFSSSDKYDAGCGWPSFTMPITTDAMAYYEDRKLTRLRTEVVSRGSQSHLGHVFEDGPEERGGLRYCINGAALRFIPLEKMREEGYLALIAYVKP